MNLFSNVVVNFHAVNDPVWLQKVINLLLKIYQIVPIEEVREYYYGGKTLTNSCHLTFDDGDKSFYEVVFPILKKNNIPVSIFVSPKAIKEQTNFWFQEAQDYDSDIFRQIINGKKKIQDDTPIYAFLKQLNVIEIWKHINNYQQLTSTSPKPCMNMNLFQIKELQKSKLVNIGAHTMNHPILRNESESSTKYEIQASVDVLSNILNQGVEDFAYPNGNPKFDFGKMEMDLLRTSGIRLAFTTEIKPFSHDDNPLAIPRTGFESGRMLYIFAKLALGKKWKTMKELWPKKFETDYR